MAESSAKGGGNFAKNIQKKVYRTKEKVLHSLGKADRTLDDAFLKHEERFAKQCNTGNRLEKEMKNYISHVKALAIASATLCEAVGDAYEEEWNGYDNIDSSIKSLTLLWEDYQHKLTDQVHAPLVAYKSHFPDMKEKIQKRHRKLVDYDSARHNMEATENAKKRDDTKIARAHDQLNQCAKVYKDINSELHTELPLFHDNRVSVLSSTFSSFFAAECVFQEESAKIKNSISELAEKLATESGAYETNSAVSRLKQEIQTKANRNDNNSEDGMKPNMHEQVTIKHSPSYPNAEESNTFERIESHISQTSDDFHDQNLSGENSESEHSFQNHLSMNGDVNSENTSQLKVHDEQYEPVNLRAQEAHGDVTEPIELQETDGDVTEPMEEVRDDVYEKIELQEAHGDVNDPIEEAQSEFNLLVETQEEINEPSAEAQSEFDLLVEAQEEINEPTAEALSESNLCVEAQEEIYEPVAEARSKFKLRVKAQEINEPNGIAEQLATKEKSAKSQESEVTENIISSQTSTHEIDISNKEEVIETQPIHNDDIYVVPFSNAPVNSNVEVPSYVLYQVYATHPYKSEDDDELTLQPGDIVYVVPYDDPDDQDVGWLMGIKAEPNEKGVNEKGVFPENFTKPLKTS